MTAKTANVHRYLAAVCSQEQRQHWQQGHSMPFSERGSMQPIMRCSSLDIRILRGRWLGGALEEADPGK